VSKPKSKSLSKGAAKLSVVEQTKSNRPPAAERPASAPVTNGGRGGGKSVMVVVPNETRAALRARAGAEETTVRVLILRALKDAGYPVPDAELVDRRRGE
jgi:hypothetical protein